MNERYFRELKRYMHCSNRTKNALLTKFQTQCREGLEDNADYEAMVANFGPPEEFAQTLMEEVPAKEVLRYRQRKRLPGWTVGAFAVVVLLLTISFWIRALQNTSPIHAIPGESLFLGTYEQDNDLENGPEDIEWLVLYRDGNRALLVSKYILDAGNHRDFERWDFSWDGSSIRVWLNEQFLTTAFTPEEQKWIPIGTDRVFLLSAEEANTYFADRDSRIASPTAYARTQGAMGSWWLRTMRTGHGSFTIVSFEGNIQDVGLPSQTFGIRPAVWVECTPGA